MFTYDVQLPEFDWNQYKEMGPIDQAGAIEAFREFPFRELISKANALGDDATAPTIVFRSSSDGSSLWYCMRSSDYREVYMEYDGQTVTVGPIDEPLMVEAIGSFFSATHADLYERLAEHPGAVTQRGLWKRLRAIFLTK
jgi:hypothetical protein